MLHSLLRLYDVSPGGNFEGHNILNRLNDLPRSMEDERRLAMLRPMLHKNEKRGSRPVSTTRSWPTGTA